MTMLVSSFNLFQSFDYTPYFFYKKRFKSEINSFCIWTLVQLTNSTNTLVLLTQRKFWILHFHGFFFCLVKMLSILNVCWIVVWKFIGYYNIYLEIHGIGSNICHLHLHAHCVRSPILHHHNLGNTQEFIQERNLSSVLIVASLVLLPAIWNHM